MKDKDEALQELIEMSKYAGERFDLVQAGGGNTSVKYGDKMCIKASGYLLSELTEDKGHTEVITDSVLAILRDDEVLKMNDKKTKDGLASQKLQFATLGNGPRPSIETYLHALLYKYTFHVHAIAVNILTSHQDWRNKLLELNEKALCVPYETPGIELALELKKCLRDYEKAHASLPKVVFLQNHGLIISSNEYEEIKELTESIVIKAEQMTGMNFSRYRSTTKISNCYNTAFGLAHMAYLSEDAVLLELLKKIDPIQLKKPFSPDGHVFCGYTLLEVDILDTESLRKYKEKYIELPKLILHKGFLYIIATDLKKAKMIEDVFKNNLLVANTLGNNLTFLEDEEISYLGNWEAEKYRQKL